MSNVGYGNHEAAKPGSAAAAVEGRQHPSTETLRPEKPAEGSKHDKDRTATPGDGASSKGPQGGEVDPGAG